jgi:drug/metabolite transporter (DMT)-like permease
VRGKAAVDALKVTAGNFVRAAAMALVVSALLLRNASFDPMGSWYAFLSGALTSGVGYAIWYTALPWLKSTTAAAVQLSVPVLAALGGVALLSEPLTLRLLAASGAIIGGIALVIVNPRT